MKERRMSELNREQIIDEIDTKIKYAKFVNTDAVILSSKAAQFCLEHAQIYEQKIKELTEENERLKATKYMIQSDGRIEMIPTVESSKVKLERITVIVREHLDDDPFEKAIAEANGAKPKGSTVGVKISVGGEQYGTYVCCKQSTLSASEVAECINGQFETLLKGLEKQETTDQIAKEMLEGT
jgi:hypothetical protein